MIIMIYSFTYGMLPILVSCNAFWIVNEENECEKLFSEWKN